MITALVLVSIQGYLAQSLFVAANPTLELILLVLPAAIFLIKELAGSSQPGVLSAKQQSILMFLAIFLTSLGIAISAVTTNPLYLFVCGVLGAAVAGLKEALGSIPIAPVPVGLPAPIPAKIGP